MRIPELTTPIPQSLLDRHAQVNQTEAIAALRAVANGRERLMPVTGRPITRKKQRSDRPRETPEQTSPSSDVPAEDNAPEQKSRGRFIDVEV